MNANSHFHYDHPEHGKMEVSAHVDKKGKATVLGVGAPGDVHVHPKHDAGLHDDHIKAMTGMASKLGRNPKGGTHMKKSEREVAIAILNKVKDLYKSHINTAHVVEEGKKITPSDSKRVEVSKVDDSDSDDLDSKADADKDASPDNNEPTNISKNGLKKKKKQASDEKDGKEPSEDAQTEPDSDSKEKVEKCGDMKIAKKSEKPLVAFLKKREEKFRGSK